MKKIALFSLVAILGVVNTSFAAGSCQIRDLKASEKQDSDEYLYVSAGHHRNKQAFACERRGDPKNCNNGVKVAVKGEHYIGGVAVGSSFEVLECQQRGLLSNDKWVNVGTSSLKKCDKSSLEYSYVLIGEMDANNKVYCMKNKYVSQGTSGWCVGIGDYDICVSDGCVDCNKPDPKPEPKPEPKPKTCEELYAGNADLIKCCKAKDAEVKNGVCKCNDSKKEWKDGKCVTKNGPVPVVGCSKYAKGTEAYDCCVHPDATWDEQKNKCFCKRYDGLLMRSKWSWGKDSNGVTRGQCIPNIHVLRARCCLQAGGQWIPNDEDEWDGRCDCGAGKTLNFSAESNVCECVGGNPVVNPIPGEGDCTLVLNVEVTCPDGFRYTKGKKIKLKKSENDGLICPNDEEIEINSVKDLEKYISKICDGHNNLAGNAGGGASGDDDMAVARKTLVEFFKNTEDNKNVWRDEEGKFNTVRLASDLTAGVVLGTVGGVVSGVVIKKKQVEKGFDALHCTVGGQNIADWGDTFNVGLRR